MDTYTRTSQLASNPKDFDFASFIHQSESPYPMWTDARRLFGWMYTLPDNVPWNYMMCFMTMAAFYIHCAYLEADYEVLGLDFLVWVDALFNVMYAVHAAATFYYDTSQFGQQSLYTNIKNIVCSVLDVLTFLHYALYFANLDQNKYFYIKFACYVVRMHKPLIFLFTLMENMRGGVLSMILKFYYVSLTLRVVLIFFMNWLMNFPPVHFENVPNWLDRNNTLVFIRFFYITTQGLMSFGGFGIPDTEAERVVLQLMMVSGLLIFSGIAVASMALTCCVFMRSEETFRARFRIILDSMKQTSTPEPLRRKVETFYRMYWLKQKAVSDTQLIPLFPPTLRHAITTDIYFEAQQKSRVLKDLSFQFLAEIAKFMQTIHYVPGDIVIKRKSTKSTMVYIVYGDIEMLTAEDDETPILRFTRGSIMNPCGGCAEVASVISHVSIRAATFCTAHVLEAKDLWEVAAKYGKTSGQAFIVHSSFEEHFEKLKRHYELKNHVEVKHKSTIVQLKRNLMELKEATNPKGKPVLARYDMFLELASCYVLRNQKNPAFKDESDPVCLQSTFPCILQPSSSLLIAWNIAIALLTVIVLFTHPYKILYFKTISLQFSFFDHFVTFVFILDIIIYLSTGTKVEEGIPVTFAVTAAKQASSFTFVVDLIATLPIFYIIGDGHYGGLNKIIKIYKVFHLLRSSEDVFINSSNTFRFIAYILLTFSNIYLLAAIWQYVNCMMGSCLLESTYKAPYWKPESKLDDNAKDRLVFSWFWALFVQTLTEYKAVHVLSKSMQLVQVLIATVLLDVSNIILIMIKAFYSATIIVNLLLRNQYQTCIEVTTNFLKTSNVDPVLRHRFIEYLKLCWHTDKAYSITHDKRNILFDLPPHVYEEIMAMQRNKYILTLPCMKLLNKGVMKKLCASSRMFYTSPNEILQNTGEICNEIYIIIRGICELVNPITRQVSNYISKNQHFGDVECLLRLPAFYTVRAVTHVQLLSISRKQLIKSEGLHNPQIVTAILYARSQPEYALLQTRQAAFLKYVIAPPPPNRECFPLPRKYEPDTAFMLPFQRLGFFAVLRYIFPRFTIRPDGKYLARYECFRALCIVLHSILCTGYETLELQYRWLNNIDYLMDISSYVDIIQRMLVAYYDEQGILIYHPVSTASHYIKGAFIVDLTACVPMEDMDSLRTIMYPVPGGYEVPSTAQFLLYNRLLQLYRLPPVLDRLNDYFDRPDIVFMIKCLPFFFACLYLTTSLMIEYSVTKYDYDDGGYALVPKLSNSVTWISHTTDLIGYNATGTAMKLILTCFYWVTMNVCNVGFNHLQPTNNHQIYILFGSLLAVFMLTTYMGVTVLSMRARVNENLATYQEHVTDLKKFMKREKIDKELRGEMDMYYEYKWEKTCGIDYRTMLRLCDQISLRTDTILHIYGQTFSKSPLLFKCDISLCRILGRAVFSLYFKKGTTLLDLDEVNRDLFIVDYGIVEMRDQEDDTQIFTKLPRGSMFGNLDNVTYKRSANRFVAGANMHLLRIDSVTFHKIIADFPAVKVLLMKFRPNDENYIIGSLRDQSVVAATYKERAESSPVIEVSKSGAKSFLSLHNLYVQIFIFLTSMASVYVDIYTAGFLDHSNLCLYILYILDVCFIVKIVLHFFQTHVSEEESDTRTALVSYRTTYLKGEFKWDLLSLVPFEAFALLHPDPWSIFGFLRLNRILRIKTANNILKHYRQKLSVSLGLMTFIGIVIWSTFIIHLCASIWSYTGTKLEEQEPQSSYRYRTYYCDRIRSNVCPTCNGSGKICKQYLCKHPYNCALTVITSIFAFTYSEDILPKQPVEVFLMIVFVILAKMFCMFLVGEITNIIHYWSFGCFNFYLKYVELMDFLKANHVSRNLVEMARVYTLHLWRETRGYQLPEFLQRAPQSLRLRVMAAAYMHHLTNHPTFQRCEPAFLRHLADCFHSYLYVEDMWVVKDAEITNSMYFVHRGRVLEVDEEMERDLELYTPGTYFGTPHGLARDFPYTLSYKTISKAQILTLTFDDWEYLLEHYPKSRDIIFKPAYKDDDDTDKKKKKLQITKAPTIRTIDRKSVQDLNARRRSSDFDRSRKRSSDLQKQTTRSTSEMLSRKQSTDVRGQQRKSNADLKKKPATKRKPATGIPSGRVSNTPAPGRTQEVQPSMPKDTAFGGIPPGRLSDSPDSRTGEVEPLSESQEPKVQRFTFNDSPTEQVLGSQATDEAEEVSEKPSHSWPTRRRASEEEEQQKPDADDEDEDEDITPKINLWRRKTVVAVKATTKAKSEPELPQNEQKNLKSVTSQPLTLETTDKVEDNTKKNKLEDHEPKQLKVEPLERDTMGGTASDQRHEIDRTRKSMSIFTMGENVDDDVKGNDNFKLSHPESFDIKESASLPGLQEEEIFKNRNESLKLSMEQDNVNELDEVVTSKMQKNIPSRSSRDMIIQTRSPNVESKGTSTTDASLLPRRSSVDEIELQKLSYSEESASKSPANKKSTILLAETVSLPEDIEPPLAQTKPSNNKPTLENIKEKKENKKERKPEIRPNMDPGLFLDMADFEAKEKRSVLSFKQDVTTVEIPMDERESVDNTGEAIDKSMSVFIDDMEMKQNQKAEAAKSPPSKSSVMPSTSSGRTRARVADERDEFDIKKYPVGRKSSFALAAVPLTETTSTSSLTGAVSDHSAVSGKSAYSWDVEDYIETDKKGSKKKKSKMPRSPRSRSSRSKSKDGGRKKHKEEDTPGSSDASEYSNTLATKPKRKWWF